MGLDGDLCILEPEDREVLVDLDFEGVNRDVQERVRSGQSFMCLGDETANELIEAFGITRWDAHDIFYHMQNKYEKELIELGVIIPNPAYSD